MYIGMDPFGDWIIPCWLKLSPKTCSVSPLSRCVRVPNRRGSSYQQVPTTSYCIKHLDSGSNLGSATPSSSYYFSSVSINYNQYLFCISLSSWPAFRSLLLALTSVDQAVR